MEQVSVRSQAGHHGQIEGRGATRTSLIIRPVKLISHKNEYLCLIRDISNSGLSIRSFHTLPDMDVVRLETQTGECYHASKVWQSDRQAGFAFNHSIDVKAAIANMGTYPKRQPRFGLRFPVVLKSGGQSTQGTILNLSQQGAKLVTPHHLAIGELVELEAANLPSLFAKVCWRSDDSYGLIFETRFLMPEFALVAARMQQPNLVAQIG